MDTSPANWIEQVLAAPDPARAWPAGAVLLDVRSEAEFLAGHIEGALLLPLDHVLGSIDAQVPDRDTPVLVYCRSGARSGVATQAMRQLGYTRVFNGGGVEPLAAALRRPIV